MTSSRQIPIALTQQPQQRSGITLLEVLISMFVMAVGMLGLAALIPVGHEFILRGAIEDNKSALGKAGLREVKVRRLLDPERWLSATGQPLGGNTANRFDAFALDPLLINRALATGTSNPQNLLRFPFAASANNNIPYLLRGTLTDINAPGLPPAVTQQLAEMVFLARNDLTLDVPDDPDLPPRQVFTTGTGQRAFEGQYSWLVTMVRDPELSNDPTVRTRNADQYTVSVVTFYRRDLTNPADTERVLPGEILGAGWGGGDLRLPGQDLPLRAGQWILVSAALPTGIEPGKGYFSWYRIVSVEDPLPGETETFVSIQGPDWNTDPPSAGGKGNAVFVSIIDGVVGVYEEVMRIERSTRWTGWN